MAALGAVHFRPARRPLTAVSPGSSAVASKVKECQAEPTVRVLKDIGLAPTR